MGTGPVAAQKKGGGCVNPGAVVTVESMLSDNNTPTTLVGDGGGYVNGQQNVTATIATCDGSGTFSMDTRKGTNFGTIIRRMFLPLSDDSAGATAFSIVVYGMADEAVPVCDSEHTSWAYRGARIYFIEPSDTSRAGWVAFQGPDCNPGTPLCQASHARVCANSATSWTVESESPHEALRIKYSKGFGRPVVDGSGTIIPEIAPFRLTVTRQ
jgi:hypothetical protein